MCMIHVELFDLVSTTWNLAHNTQGVSIRFTGCDYFFPYNEELQLGPPVVFQQICPRDCLSTVDISRVRFHPNTKHIYVI